MFGNIKKSYKNLLQHCPGISSLPVIFLRMFHAFVDCKELASTESGDFNPSSFT